MFCAMKLVVATSATCKHLMPSLLDLHSAMVVQIPYGTVRIKPVVATLAAFKHLMPGLLDLQSALNMYGTVCIKPVVVSSSDAWSSGPAERNRGR
jgi:hypothetical protein